MSSVIAGFQASGFQGITVGGTGTAVKYFPYVPGPSIGVARTTPSAASSIGQLKVPGNNRLNGQAFVVDVVGVVQTGSGIACPNVTFALFAQTNVQVDGHNPVYTAIATTGAIAAGSQFAEAVRLKADLSGDTLSGMVQGSQTAYYDGTLRNSTPKAVENLLSGINFNADVPFGLVVGVTFSVSSADNSATIYQFTLSA
jgi:hypothetical protein